MVQNRHIPACMIPIEYTFNETFYTYLYLVEFSSTVIDDLVI
jgi:hypothetical protein